MKRLTNLTDDALRTRAFDDWREYKLAEDYETDPTISKWKRNEWRKTKRHAGRRLHNAIEELDRRNLPRPWETDGQLCVRRRQPASAR